MIRTALIGAAVALTALPAGADEFEPRLRALVDTLLRPIAASPEVVQAIRTQNEGMGDVAQGEIDRLDAAWRAQVGAADAPLIDGVRERPASAMLVRARDEAGGLLTEIFAMDRHGLNVAVSDPTSDYWQGDEAKWRDTYAAGPDAVHISGIELDESTQTYQSQVSLPVVDPDSGDPIGAVTFGVNVELLP